MTQNKEKLLLIGAGGFGRQISELARLEFDCSFVDDNEALKNTLICDIPVIGTLNDLKELRRIFEKALVTIGNNITREKVFRKISALGYETPNLIYPNAYVSQYSHIGEGCIIMNYAHVQNGSKLGDGVILHPGSEAHHDSIIGDFSMIYTNSCIRTKAKLGQRCWVDSTVTVPNFLELEPDTTFKR